MGYRDCGWPEAACSASAPWHPPGGASGAERSEAALGATKEVLGFIIAFDFNLDLLGSPLLYYRSPRIS